MKILCNWYDLEVNSDRSEKVRYNYTDVPIGFFTGRHSAYANSSMPAHWHEDIELFVPYEGEVIYNINGHLVTVKAGEGILINSRRIHSSVTEGLRDCYYNLLIFHPMLLCMSKEIEQQLVQPIIGSSFDYIHLKKGTPWHDNVFKWFSEIRNRLILRYTNEALTDLHVKPSSEFKPLYKTSKIAVIGLVNIIWSEISANITPDDVPHGECSQLSSMKAMIAYIDAHYTEKITLEDIAAAGFVSKRTCGNMFERFLFTPPMKYLNEYRLKKSIELLKGTDMNITEIGLACGFSGASYYAESFRREMGISPSDYRKTLNDNTRIQAVLKL